MISKAKVSIVAIKTLKSSADEIKNYSPRFEKGKNCLNIMCQHLDEYNRKLHDSECEMQIAQNILTNKIKEIEDIIVELKIELNHLENQLSNLKYDLANTPCTTTEYIDDKEVKVPNLKYEEIKKQISDIKSDIRKVKDGLYEQQTRLNHAKNVYEQLLDHINIVKNTILELEEKNRECKRLYFLLSDLQKENLIQGTSVVQSLNEIQKLIIKYTSIKMKYEDVSLHNEIIETKFEPIGSNTVENNKNHDTLDFKQRVLSKQAENVVRMNNGTVIYNGKIFGGVHNTYNDRFKATITDSNAVLGKYEEMRGESKFIPSNRTADGIVVIDILKQYDMNGIDYINAEPDFEPCSEAVVSISKMTENRHNYVDTNGEVALGNFSQADIEMAIIWNQTNRDNRQDWKPRDVLNYRKANRLTWHEKCDTKTMVLVRQEINAFFKHSGGCSECRIRDCVISEVEFDE